MLTLLAVMVAAAACPQASPSADVWTVNESNALVWAGKPYLPVGARFDGTVENVAKARAAGLKDVIVDLPANGAGWKPVFEALESAGMRYLVAISSMAPAATGIAVEPEGYRVPNLVAETKLDIALPGATEALLVMAMQRDGSVGFVRKVSLRDGALVETVDPRSELEHVLLIYPKVRSMRVPDFWSSLDNHRDELLQALRTSKPGAGLRGLLNPLGRVARFPSPDVRFVPTDPVFRPQMEAFLRAKYTSLQPAIRTWSISAPDFDSFEAMARLVPLWSSMRGVPLLWDPSTDRTYECDSRKSAAWKDIQEVVVESARRRYARLTAAIQQVCNVPILQEWSGWAGPYAVAQPPCDGIGSIMDATSPATGIDSLSRPAAQALLWTKPGWFLVSDLRSPQPGGLDASISDATSLGARGWFVRSSDPATLKAVAESAPRHGADDNVSRWKPSPVFFPDAALNPAAPMRLSGGSWWLPSPASGNRIELGSGYAGYRMVGSDRSFTALWSRTGSKRVVLRLAESKGVVFECVDGTDPKPRRARKGVEVTIGTTPMLVSGTSEIPIPEDSLSEALAQFESLATHLERKLPDLGEQRMLFRDNVASFDRNPGGSFAAIREQIERLNLLAADYLWVEAETSRQHTFSEAPQASGTSNGTVLRLQTQLGFGAARPYALYRLIPTVEGPHSLWIAARIPEIERRHVSVLIGDQRLALPPVPVSFYSTGYGWYELGQVSLARGEIELRIDVDASTGADLDLDVILATPDPFRPDGIRRPLALKP